MWPASASSASELASSPPRPRRRRKTAVSASAIRSPRACTSPTPMRCWSGRARMASWPWLVAMVMAAAGRAIGARPSVALAVGLRPGPLPWWEAAMASSLSLVLVRLLAIVVLVLFNGFFVAAEFALVRSRRTRLEARAAEGDRLAGLALRGTTNISSLLSASQLGRHAGQPRIGMGRAIGLLRHRSATRWAPSHSPSSSRSG